MRLRVKDVDCTYRHRPCALARVPRTAFPRSLVEPLQRHLARVKLLHEAELLAGYGEVYLPYAFDRKDPHAGTVWVWQYVFQASKRSLDPRWGVERRHHIRKPCCPEPCKRPSGGQVSLNGRAVTPCATVLPPICSKTAMISVRCRNSWGIRTFVRLWSYTHVLRRGGRGVRSPLDPR